MKKLIVFHPAIAPYRIDFFNSLQADFNASFHFLYMDALEQSFDQDKLRKKLHFIPRYLPAGLFGLRNLRLKVLSILRKEKPDVVFCSEYNLLGILVWLYKSLYNRRLEIVTICDDSKEMAENATGKKRWLRAFLIKRFDRIVVANRQVQEWYIKHFASSEKFIYLPIVQDDSIFRENLKEALPVTERIISEYDLYGKQALLYVGRLVSVKNLSLLLKVFGTVTQEFPKARLILVGDGENKPLLKEETARLGLEEKVVFTGKKQGQELAALYNTGQIFVLPSFYEPFGAVVNEALLAGCYTICSEVAGSATLIREGENGSLFDPVSEEALLQKMRETLGNCPLVGGATVKPNRMLRSYKDYMNDFIREINTINRKIKR